MSKRKCEMGRTTCVDFSVARKPTYLTTDGAPIEFSYTPEAKKETILKGNSITIPPDDSMFLGQLAFAETLGPDDTLLLEMGSGADAFVVNCRRRGVNIFRVPPRRLKMYREAHDLGDDETTIALRRLFDEDADAFYQIEEKAEEITQLAAVLNTFYFYQKRIRIALGQRSLSIERSIRLLFEPEDKHFEEALELQMATLKSAEKEENFWFNRLTQAANKCTFASDYLLSLPGIGPRICGRVVGTVSDIRRFETIDDLVSYLGYDVHDGQAPRMKRNMEEDETFNPRGMQGVWYFPDCVNRMPEDHPLKAVLLARKAWIAKCQPDTPPWYIHNKAKRWLGHQFIKYLWASWRHYLGITNGIWRGWDLLTLAQNDIESLKAHWGRTSASEQSLENMKKAAA